MKARLKKKITKANELFDHNANYTPREIMNSYHWWKKFLRIRKGIKIRNSKI